MGDMYDTDMQKPTLCFGQNSLFFVKYILGSQPRFGI